VQNLETRAARQVDLQASHEGGFRRPSAWRGQGYRGFGALGIEGFLELDLFFLILTCP
jgi:hypothetical protein